MNLALVKGLANLESLRSKSESGLEIVLGDCACLQKGYSAKPSGKFLNPISAY